MTGPNTDDQGNAADAGGQDAGAGSSSAAPARPARRVDRSSVAGGVKRADGSKGHDSPADGVARADGKAQG